MSTKFHIDVGSDPDFEDLTAEIYCGEDPQNDFVGIVSQEFGFDSLDIEIHPRRDGKPWRFKYFELLQALEKAKTRLWELRKIPKVNEEDE
jgi:hypothetical protein